MSLDWKEEMGLNLFCKVHLALTPDSCEDGIMKREFGPRFAFSSFVFDPGSGDLTQNGVRVRMNKQIADLLTLLVRNADQLVTREQIRQTLWPDQEFLNHEKIITNAISRLRHIFRDDPASPEYIESVPKRGYRLVVKVRELPPRDAERAPVAAMPLERDAGFRETGAEAGLMIPTATVLESRGLESASAKPAFAKGKLPVSRRWIYLATAAALLILMLPTTWRWWSVRRSPAVSGLITLGIAPFETSGAGAKELAESFRLDLTDSLAQLPHVNVRAAHSLELFSQDGSTFRDRANKLGLDTLLLGHFTVEGSVCHLQLELVRGKDLAHIASFQYTASREELATVRDKIQMETFRKLNLTTDEKSSPTSGSVQGETSDPRAYDAYLRAGYHLSQQTNESLRLALKEYEEATAIDPHFAKAYAHEARTYFFLEQNNLVPEDEGFRKANDAARRALELDASSPEAHAVLGFIAFLYEWNLPAGERELQAAILGDPNQPFFHQGLALIFCDEGRFHEALSEIDLAHANDPFWISAYITEAHIASIAQDGPRVQAVIRKLMDLSPDSPHVRDAIGNAEWNTGHNLEAIREWRAMATIEGDKDRVLIEDRGLEAFRKGGAPAYAEVRLAAIQSGKGVQMHSNDFVSAEWCAIAGDADSALKAIRQGIRGHDSAMLGLGVLPAYNAFRGNGEFQALLSSLGPSLPVKYRQ